MNSNRVSNVFTGALGINALITGFAADDIHLRIQCCSRDKCKRVRRRYFSDFVSTTWSYFIKPVPYAYAYDQTDLWRVNHNFEVSLTSGSFDTIVAYGSELCRFTFSPPPRRERKTGFAERGGSRRSIMHLDANPCRARRPAIGYGNDLVI